MNTTLTGLECPCCLSEMTKPENQEGFSSVMKEFVECQTCGFNTHEHHFINPNTLEEKKSEYIQHLESQAEKGLRATNKLSKMAGRCINCTIKKILAKIAGIQTSSSCKHCQN